MKERKRERKKKRERERERGRERERQTDRARRWFKYLESVRCTCRMVVLDGMRGRDVQQDK